MSDSMSPWLRKAAENYADVHGELLGQPLFGQRVQLLRVTGNPDYQEMWTEMGDKELWINVLFPRHLINDFNAQHASPFLSLRHHLFTIESYTFAILQPHASSQPGSDFPYTTLSPRMCIQVNSFRYFGSGCGVINDGPSLGSFAEQKGELGGWLRSAVEKRDLDMQHMKLTWRPAGEEQPPVVHSKSSPRHSQTSAQETPKKERRKRKFGQVWEQTYIDSNADEWRLGLKQRHALSTYEFFTHPTAAQAAPSSPAHHTSPAPLHLTSPAPFLPTSPAHTVLLPQPPSSCPNPSLDNLPEEVEELLAQGWRRTPGEEILGWGGRGEEYPPPRQRGRCGSVRLESMESAEEEGREEEGKMEETIEEESGEDVEMEEAQRSEEERSGASDMDAARLDDEDDSSSSESPAPSLRSSIPFGTLGDASLESFNAPSLPANNSPPLPSLVKRRALPTPATTSTASHDPNPSSEEVAPSSPIRAELVERSQQRSQENSRSQEELRGQEEVRRNHENSTLQEEVRKQQVRLRAEEVLGRETRWEKVAGRRRVRVLSLEEWLSVRGEGEEWLFHEAVMERLRVAREGV